MDYNYVAVHLFSFMDMLWTVVLGVRFSNLPLLRKYNNPFVRVSNGGTIFLLRMLIQ